MACLVGWAEVSPEAFALIAAAHRAWPLDWRSTSAGGSGKLHPRSMGPAAAGCLLGLRRPAWSQERQGSPGKQLQGRPRPHWRRAGHLMGPEGAKVLPTVGTTQLHWVDRWPSE